MEPREMKVWDKDDKEAKREKRLTGKGEKLNHSGSCTTVFTESRFCRIFFQNVY